MSKFFRHFGNAGVLFPAANLCNFMQGGNSVATGIAAANLAYAILLIGGAWFLKGSAKASRIGMICQKLSTAIHDDVPTANLFKLAGRECLNPLRIAAYAALTVSGLLIASAIDGNDAALFPGLAALFFGIGNFLQSSLALMRVGGNSPAIRALTHPAPWYGLGYTMTGIGIGGGLALLADPLDHTLSCFLTAIGIAETLGSAGLMLWGRIVNRAAPFVGLAIGTMFFASAGMVTANLLGIATVVFACAGELSLAVAMQKLYNASIRNTGVVKPASRIENALTAPIRFAMKRGWIASLPAVV